MAWWEMARRTDRPDGKTRSERVGKAAECID